MLTIHLNRLKFFSFHGIHAEEKILGNEYEVNVDIKLGHTEKIDTINQTIDYERVYDIIKARMAVPSPLLETLAQDMSERIHQMDVTICSINIRIIKMNPPIENFLGMVGVTWHKEY
jgi:7,8-dihydroneopterin aldolase/epimerase/oxygenase